MKNDNRGLVKAIVIVIIALIILSYLKIDLKGLFLSETWQNNWTYIWNAITWIWTHILVIPVTFAWNKIVVPLWGIVWMAFEKGISLIGQAAGK